VRLVSAGSSVESFSAIGGYKVAQHFLLGADNSAGSVRKNKRTQLTSSSMRDRILAAKHDAGSIFGVSDQIFTFQRRISVIHLSTFHRKKLRAYRLLFDDG
jgi:hypothetical protein